MELLNDHYNIIYKLDIENAANEEHNQYLHYLSEYESSDVNDNEVDKNIELEEEIINYVEEDSNSGLEVQYMALEYLTQEEAIIRNSIIIEFENNINLLMNDIDGIHPVVLDFLNNLDSERENFLNILALQLDDIKSKLNDLKNGLNYI